jgi:hypothetical protein
MSLVEQLAEEIAQVSAARSATDEFIRLSAFYDEMKRLGLTKKSEYELPLIDTIGRTLYSRSALARTRP